MKTTELAVAPLTGDVALDATHQALYAELWRIATLPRAAFDDAFHTAVALLERDFRQEEEMMERMAFPGLLPHREQHARALAGLHHAAAALAEGDERPARHAMSLLLDWLTLHIGTMDFALAAACRRARGPRAADM